jgi:hypothetical protein
MKNEGIRGLPRRFLKEQRILADSALAGKELPAVSKVVRFANVVIGITAFFIAGVSAFLLSQHGLSLPYVALPLLACLCLAFLRLPDTAKILCSLLLIGATVSLYTAETVARFLLPVDLTWADIHDETRGLAWSRDRIDDRANWAREAGQTFDTRNRLQVIQDLEAQGISAYPPIAGNVVIKFDGQDIFPLAGISNITTVYCNESGEYTIYRSDEHGFHNPPGIWDNGRIEIAVLGDSFAHGACVPSDENFISLIRARYPWTLNLAMGGSGPLHELAMLIEYGSAVHPSIVLWVYYEGNDLEDLSQKKDGLLKPYLTSGPFQGLITKQPAIDRALREKITQVRREIETAQRTASLMDDVERFIKLDMLRIRVKRALRPVPTSVSDETLTLFNRIVEQTAQKVHAWGGRLIFVYLPQYDRYTNPQSASHARERVLALFRQVGDDVIDLHPVFAAHRDPVSLFPFRRRGHYTVEGNRLIAETILARLNRPLPEVP